MSCKNVELMTIIIIGYWEKKSTSFTIAHLKLPGQRKRTQYVRSYTKFCATAKQGQSIIIHLLLLNQQKCLME